MTFFQVMANITRGCPSSGWVLALTAGHAHLLSVLFSEQAQQEISCPDGEYRAPASLNGSASAVPVAGGQRVSGTWSYWRRHSSPDSDGRLLAVAPRGGYTIVGDWGVLSMRGTGSLGAWTRPRAQRTEARSVAGRRLTAETPGVGRRVRHRCARRERMSAASAHNDARWSRAEPPWLARSPALNSLQVRGRARPLPARGGTTSGSPQPPPCLRWYVGSRARLRNSSPRQRGPLASLELATGCGGWRRRFSEAAAPLRRARAEPPGSGPAADRVSFAAPTDPGCRLREQPYHASRRAMDRLEQRAENVRVDCLRDAGCWSWLRVPDPAIER
jgi:hypothetical protein